MILCTSIKIFLQIKTKIMWQDTNNIQSFDKNLTDFKKLKDDKNKIEDTDIVSLLKDENKVLREDFKLNLKKTLDDISALKSSWKDYTQQVNYLLSKIEELKILDTYYNSHKDEILKTTWSAAYILSEIIQTKEIVKAQLEWLKKEVEKNKNVLPVESNSAKVETKNETKVEVKKSNYISWNEFWTLMKDVFWYTDQSLSNRSTLNREYVVLSIIEALKQKNIISQSDIDKKSSSSVFSSDMSGKDIKIIKSINLAKDLWITNWVTANRFDPEWVVTHETAKIFIEKAKNLIETKKQTSEVLDWYNLSFVSKEDFSKFIENKDNLVKILSILDLKLSDFSWTKSAEAKKDFSNRLKSLYDSWIGLWDMATLGKPWMDMLFTTLGLKWTDRFDSTKFKNALISKVNYKVDNKYVYIPLSIIIQWDTKIKEFADKQKAAWILENSPFDIKSANFTSLENHKKAEFETNLKKLDNADSIGLKYVEKYKWTYTVMFVPKTNIDRIAWLATVQVEETSEWFYISWDKEAVKKLCYTVVSTNAKSEKVLLIGSTNYADLSKKEYKTTITTSVESLQKIKKEESSWKLKFEIDAKDIESAKVYTSLIDGYFDAWDLATVNWIKAEKTKINKLMEWWDINGSWNIFVKSLEKVLGSKEYRWVKKLDKLDELYKNQANLNVDQKRLILESYIQSTAQESYVKNFEKRHTYFDQVMAKELWISVAEFTKHVSSTRNEYVSWNQFLQDAKKSGFNAKWWEEEVLAYDNLDLFALNVSISNSVATLSSHVATLKQNKDNNSFYHKDIKNFPALTNKLIDYLPADVLKNLLESIKSQESSMKNDLVKKYPNATVTVDSKVHTIEDVKKLLKDPNQKTIDFDTIYFKSWVCTNDSYGILFNNVKLEATIIENGSMPISTSAITTLDISWTGGGNWGGGDGWDKKGNHSSQPWDGWEWTINDWGWNISNDKQDKATWWNTDSSNPGGLE